MVKTGIIKKYSIICIAALSIISGGTASMFSPQLVLMIIREIVNEVNMSTKTKQIQWISSNLFPNINTPYLYQYYLYHPYNRIYIYDLKILAFIESIIVILPLFSLLTKINSP